MRDLANRILLYYYGPIHMDVRPRERPADSRPRLRGRSRSRRRRRSSVVQRVLHIYCIIVAS